MDGSEDPAILVDDSEVGSICSRSDFLADAPNFLILILSEYDKLILNTALNCLEIKV